VPTTAVQNGSTGVYYIACSWVPQHVLTNVALRFRGVLTEQALHIPLVSSRLSSRLLFGLPHTFLSKLRIQLRIFEKESLALFQFALLEHQGAMAIKQEQQVGCWRFACSRGRLPPCRSLGSWLSGFLDHGQGLQHSGSRSCSVRPQSPTLLLGTHAGLAALGKGPALLG
jgi:hypothetical protein